MARNGERQNGQSVEPQGNMPYDRAVLGFRNYWYPTLLAKEVTERRPKAAMLLGDEVVFIRRQGRVYALADECPHRGTRLSRGKHEFPGTPTIACRYHGWVFDVTNGACVAALTDGPDSPVVGKVRVRTYPVEERKGLLWIWMGKGAPVPIEEDVPPLVLREDTWLNTRSKLVYGNWRWHTENPPGHAFMLHRDSIHMLTSQFPASTLGDYAELAEDGEDGEWLLHHAKGVIQWGEYPGLGQWPRPGRPWRRTGNLKKMDKQGAKPVRGVRYGRWAVSSRLPCITRIQHAPITGCMYYEWYVPVDEDHYNYFQMSCYWPKNLLDRLWFYAKFYGYGRPAQFWRFNDQDKAMVGDSTDFAKRHGGNWPSKLFRADAPNIAWREYVNTHARGEAAKAPKPKPEKAAVKGS